jgi:metal-responsive CopG/Arc/MetJ family transcriptional regulator
METIQIVLDKSLLQATDRAARRMKRNRSALVREALHLKRLEVRTSEELDREGYEKHAQARDEFALWEAASLWAAISVSRRFAV